MHFYNITSTLEYFLFSLLKKKQLSFENALSLLIINWNKVNNSHSLCRLNASFPRIHQGIDSTVNQHCAYSARGRHHCTSQAPSVISVLERELVGSFRVSVGYLYLWSPTLFGKIKLRKEKEQKVLVTYHWKRLKVNRTIIIH